MFAYNATDALSMAIQGFVERGDHVITSATEHNFVLRPHCAIWICEGTTISLDIISCDQQGYLKPDIVWETFQQKQE